MDSEKISSLYADLRRQSSISGGVPIAVRHIESVMRMAEASAKMHLRDHVREDDVDLAIKVMLESFMQAQKVSIRKVLQRSFRKYVTYGEESNQLLMHQLQTLITEAEKYKRLKGVSSDSTEVFINELENRAKELNIFDLKVIHLIITLIKYIIYSYLLSELLAFIFPLRSSSHVALYTINCPFSNSIHVSTTTILLGILSQCIVSQPWSTCGRTTTIDRQTLLTTDLSSPETKQRVQPCVEMYVMRRQQSTITSPPTLSCHVLIVITSSPLI